MEHLAGASGELRSDYDAVVVGTGYGGGVAACRLARAGRDIAVIERGKEYRPGDFPSSAVGAAREVQIHRAQGRSFGSERGLFDFRLSDDVVALIGCGVGGTSLINANVSLVPEPAVFDDPRWPPALRRGAADASLAAGYDRARAMLRPATYPEADRPPLPKLQALETAGGEASGAGAIPINVTFTEKRHSTGRVQPACTGCGDCVTGCNVGAKNTIDQTYIPDAVAHGAHLVANTTVVRVEPGAIRRWAVITRPTGSDGPDVRVEADTVVIAGGTFGSTEILARSKRAGLWVSPTLGTTVSGNGDFLGYAYDADQRVNGVGLGDKVLVDDPVGPCISGGFEVEAPFADGTGSTDVLFEEGTLPSPMARLAPLGLLGLVLRKKPRSSRERTRRWRHVRSLVQGVRKGPVARTLVFLGMGYDDDAGRLIVPDDDEQRAVLDWPGAGTSPFQLATDVAAAAMADRLDASYLRSPVWGRFLTVHPLGGCGMGTTGTDGVVDEHGQVFAGAGDERHEGLHVLDGSIVPTPLGKNPSFTITALAERALDHLLDGHPSRTSDEPAPALAGPKGGVAFDERMQGFCRAPLSSTDEVLDLRLSISFPDLDALHDDPAHPGVVRGTVEIGVGDLGVTTITSGTLSLFDPDPTRVDEAVMRYDLTCRSHDGRRWRVVGEKRMHDNPGFDMWRDTTHLAVTITALGGAPGDEPLVHATGKAGLGVRALWRMTRSMRRTGGTQSDAATVGRFGLQFAKGLLGTYGKVFRQGESFRSIHDQPPERDLAVPPPTTYWCRRDLRWVDDDPGSEAMLKLQRFQGGTKGPVMLAPGFAMSASQFLIDTIEPNLVEQLVAAGYDVWLFDYRAGIEMATARSTFSVDDVARTDWPRAVAKVCEVAGVDDVQVIAHCVGSMSLQMALLGGMTGIRSAITSQVTVHPRMHWSMTLKTRFRVPRMLEGLGIRTVEPETEMKVSDRLLDIAVRANPLLHGERCGNPVCRWVFFFFGPTHVHDQLDAASHQRVAKLFGVASLHALDHIAMCVNAGHAVDSEGRDTYLPHIDRFRVPITFLSGGRNKIFYPTSTRATLAWLRENTPPAQFASLYRELHLPDYAHLDNFIGRDAPTEVFPLLIEDLDRFN